VRVGSKTGGLPGKTRKTRVLAGRSQGTDREATADVGATATWGEPRGLHKPRRPWATRRDQGCFTATPLELILRGALLFVLVPYVYRVRRRPPVRRAGTTARAFGFPHRNPPAGATAGLPA